MNLPPLLTLRSAARLSLTEDQLRGRRFRRLHQGVYAPADRELTPTVRAAAALLVLPRDAVITGVTALHLHGTEIGTMTPIRAATATTGQTRRPGIRLSRLEQLPEAHDRTARPLPAWLAACVEFDLVQAVAAADWLIRTRKTTLTQLRDAAAKAASGHGSRLARRAAELAREQVDSPKESKLRLLLVLAGLPEPRCTDPRQWSIDIARHEAAVNAGYLIIRVTAARLRRPREVAETVHARLRERGYTGPPPQYPSEWQVRFETAPQL